MKNGLKFLLMAALLVPAAAAAKPPAKHGKSKGHDKGPDVVVVEHRFSGRDRDLVRIYYVEHPRRGCPPGLAKKGNGCLPPGQAKKRYLVGRPLDAVIVIEPLPPVLVARLGPPPDGYRYGVVDGDVVKLVVGTLLVADAIEGLIR